MLTGQMKKSDDYNKFKKCINISILDYNMFDDKKYKTSIVRIIYQKTRIIEYLAIY